jgi:diacylglycerol kinase family enzyme
MPICEFVQCVAYRLEPLTPGSFNDLDGEVIEPGPIQGEVIPAALNVFCQDKLKPFKPPVATGTSV